MRMTRQVSVDVITAHRKRVRSETAQILSAKLLFPVCIDLTLKRNLYNGQMVNGAPSAATRLGPAAVIQYYFYFNSEKKNNTYLYILGNKL